MFEPRLLGHVSTEGGPLLIADRTAIASWAGVDTDDYDQLARALDVSEPRALAVTRGGLLGLAWNVPTGTTQIWRTGPSSLLLTRSWVDDVKDLPDLANLPMENGEALGAVSIRSGWLVVVWAAESCESVLAVEPKDGLSLDLSVGGAGLVIRMATGEYECRGDEVDIGTAGALRCHIRPCDIRNAD